jgi:hypothetical protein
MEHAIAELNAYPTDVHAAKDSFHDDVECLPVGIFLLPPLVYTGGARARVRGTPVHSGIKSDGQRGTLFLDFLEGHVIDVRDYGTPKSMLFVPVIPAHLRIVLQVDAQEPCQVRRGRILVQLRKEGKKEKEGREESEARKVGGGW